MGSSWGCSCTATVDSALSCSWGRCCCTPTLHLCIVLEDIVVHIVVGELGDEDAKQLPSRPACLTSCLPSPPPSLLVVLQETLFCRTFCNTSLWLRGKKAENHQKFFPFYDFFRNVSLLRAGIHVFVISLICFWHVNFNGSFPLNSFSTIYYERNFFPHDISFHRFPSDLSN